MAEFPELIRAIFLNEKKNQNEQEVGLYSLVFCKNGVRQVVKIDDYIPCTPSEGPVYSRGNGPELWVMLIEKAYAKVSITLPTRSFFRILFPSAHSSLPPPAAPWLISSLEHGICL
jgi:hypothetical protein